MRFLILVCVAAVSLVACRDADDGFNFVIPPDVNTPEDAIYYVQLHSAHGVVAIQNSDVQIMAGDASVWPGATGSVLVSVQSKNVDESIRQQRHWERELRELFNRWDICDIDVAWTFQHFSNPGLPVRAQFGFEKWYNTPGCESN